MAEDRYSAVFDFHYSEGEWAAILAATPPLPEDYDADRLRPALEWFANQFLWQQNFVRGIPQVRLRRFKSIELRWATDPNVSLIWKVRQEMQHKNAARDAYINGLLVAGWRDLLGQPIRTSFIADKGESGPLIRWLDAVASPAIRKAGLERLSAAALRKLVRTQKLKIPPSPPPPDMA